MWGWVRPSMGWWNSDLPICSSGTWIQPSWPSSKSSRRRRGSPWPLRPTPLRSIDLRVQGRRRLPQINRKHVTPNPKCVTHVLNLFRYLCSELGLQSALVSIQPEIRRSAAVARSGPWSVLSQNKKVKLCIHGLGRVISLSINGYATLLIRY